MTQQGKGTNDGYVWKLGGVLGTSLLAQWLRLYTPNAEGVNPMPGQGTRSHMPQLRVCTPELKILWATTKNQYDQISKYILNEKKKKKTWLNPKHQVEWVREASLKMLHVVGVHLYDTL